MYAGVGVGDFWQELQKVADKVSGAAGTISEIRTGNKQVAVLPTYQGVQQAAASVPWTPILLGAAALFLLPKLLRR